jgi:uncharacterized membrane protein
MKTSFRNIIYGFCLFAVSLLAYRIYKTESLIYIFLAWNLFLALIPYWISSYLAKAEQLKYIHLPLIAAWILFLPNSPYIITDLFHLKQRHFPFWYDLVLVYSFALIGFVVFYKSVFDIIKLVRNRIPDLYLRLMLPPFFWLIAFGLYLGRYLRFNSWNVVNHPFRIVNQSFEALFSKDTIGFTLIFAVFMWLVYLTLVNFNSKEKI